MKKYEILALSIGIAAMMFVFSSVFYGAIYALCCLILGSFPKVILVIKVYLVGQTIWNTVSAVFKAYSQISAGKTSISC